MEAIPEEAVQIGDGASDFFPSDCEDDEEVVTHTRLNRHSAQKYYERGSRAFHSILGTSGTTQVQPPHWISTLHKYSVEERRWVNKGPVLLYFVQFGTRIRLVANYLYGIKSIALNMESEFAWKSGYGILTRHNSPREIRVRLQLL